ncbi:MAG: hypothetical protein U0694_06870 [Anaerolineae bacterium]
MLRTPVTASAADADITPEALEARLRELHQQYASRELESGTGGGFAGRVGWRAARNVGGAGLPLRSVRPRICQC